MILPLFLQYIITTQNYKRINASDQFFFQGGSIPPVSGRPLAVLHHPPSAHQWGFPETGKSPPLNAGLTNSSTPVHTATMQTAWIETLLPLPFRSLPWKGTSCSHRLDSSCSSTSPVLSPAVAGNTGTAVSTKSSAVGPDGECSYSKWYPLRVGTNTRTY